MTISKRETDNMVDGKKVLIYTLTNKNGLAIDIMNYGGNVLSIKVPDKNGVKKDVVLGFNDFKDYESSTVYFGALVGRCANRLKDAKINLNGVQYNLAKNDGNNHLHGGNRGFDKVIWNSEIDENGQALKLSYLSRDGEENYPGNLKITVKYKLSEDNSFSIDYEAETDKDTVANFTNHSYFNLAGHDSGSILNHKLKINSESFTPADKESLPTGEIRSVENTPLDFRTLTRVGDRIDDDYDQLQFAGGYDHNWIVGENDGKLKNIATLVDENSGRAMDVFTTLPGVQFYAGNFLDGTQKGKGGVMYEKRNGLCLETQLYPNALVNKNFPSIVLKKDEKYKSTTIYKFYNL